MKTLTLLLLVLLCSCAGGKHLQVRNEQLIYTGYERHQRGGGYVYFLQWRDAAGGAAFWSVQDSIPQYPIGFVKEAYLNF